MILENVVKLVIFLSIPPYLLLAVFLFTNKRGKPFANRILGMFFLSQTFSCLNIFAYLNRDIVVTFAPDLLFIFSGFIFLWAPLMYFYFLALTDARLCFKWKDLFHTLPFFLQFAYILIFFVRFPFDIKAGMLSERTFPHPSVWFTFCAALYTLAGFYIFKSIKAWRAYRIRIMNDSLQNAVYRMTWIRLLIFLFSLEFFVALLDFLTAFFGTGPSVRPLLLLFAMGIPTIVVFIIMFKGLRTPEVFSGPVEKAKYSSSHLQENEKEKIRIRLEQFLKDEKLYRNPSLTLEMLAGRLLTKPKYLSQIINEYYGKSFREWINDYRIEEAKTFLTDQKDPKKTILEVLYEVGFNSKASFNAAFKANTKMTPKEFRRQYHRSQNLSKKSANI